jgi:hypothetical protein
VVTVTLPDTAAAREGRLAVPVTVARGQARLSGVVRAPGGAPLANARVSVAGTDVAGTTSPNGAFSLAGLPAGTYSLEVRALGYAPTRVAVNLSRTRPAAVAVTVNERLSTLETVVVQADRTRLQKDYTGFAERSKRGGFGRFITEADINRRNPMVLTDVLRTVPGVRVVPNGQFGYTVQGRGQLHARPVHRRHAGARRHGADRSARAAHRRGGRRGVHRRRGRAGAAPGSRRERVRRGGGVVAARAAVGRRPSAARGRGDGRR